MLSLTWMLRYLWTRYSYFSWSETHFCIFRTTERFPVLFTEKEIYNKDMSCCEHRSLRTVLDNSYNYYLLSAGVAMGFGVTSLPASGIPSGLLASRRKYKEHFKYPFFTLHIVLFIIQCYFLSWLKIKIFFLFDVYTITKPKKQVSIKNNWEKLGTFHLVHLNIALVLRDIAKYLIVRDSRFLAALN